MSHFIDTMAYAGNTPWHKLGKYLGDQNVDSATMIKAAGLDYEVRKAAIYVKHANGMMVEVPEQYAMVRSDSGNPLPGSVVGDRYVEWQNANLFEFGDALRTESGNELQWHTAGSLKGGRIVWALAQMAGAINVERKNGSTDVTAPFLLLSNSFDGSSGIRVCNTPIRVVCWNTLSAALSRGAVHNIRHTASATVKLTEAAKALGYAVEYFTEYAETAQTLADAKMSREEFATFCAQLLTGKDDAKEALTAVAEAKGRSETRIGNTAEQLFTNFVRGKGNSGADRYDAINAVTEYVDHQRGRMSAFRGTQAAQLAGLDKALHSSQFGTGADMKARALKLLRA